MDEAVVWRKGKPLLCSAPGASVASLLTGYLGSTALPHALPQQELRPARGLTDFHARDNAFLPSECQTTCR